MCIVFVFVLNVAVLALFSARRGDIEFFDAMF